MTSEDRAVGRDAELLTADDQKVWLDLMGLIMRLPSALESALREAGDVMLVEFIVLAYLAEAPDHSRRMTTIANESHLPRSRTSYLVARLESRGLVVRHPAADDKRAITATLTRSGVELVKKLAPVHAADARSRVLDRLTAEEKQQLLSIARKISTSSRA